jgi:hypothetical protein
LEKSLERDNEKLWGIEDVEQEDGSENLESEEEVELFDDCLVVRIFLGIDVGQNCHSGDHQHRSKSDERTHCFVVQVSHGEFQKDEERRGSQEEEEKEPVLIQLGKGIVADIASGDHFCFFCL